MLDWIENTADFGKEVVYRGIDTAGKVAESFNYAYGGQWPVPLRPNSSREKERGNSREAQGPGAQFSQPQNAQAFGDSSYIVLSNDVESSFQSRKFNITFY